MFSTRAVIVVALGALLGAANVSRAQRAPTGTELQAAYCVKVTQAQLSALQAIDRGNPNKKPATEEIIDAQKRLNRLQVYIDSQVPSLEPTRMLDAMRQGESDGAQYFSEQLDDRCAKACGSSNLATDEADEKTKRCLVDCMHGDEFFSRVASCKDLSWLP